MSAINQFTNDMSENKFENENNKQIVLTPGNSYGIGKKNYNNDRFITINDPLMDDKHALIEIAADGKFMLTDLYSVSGTYVKGDRLTPFTKVELRGSRLIVMGNTCFTFTMASKQLKKNDSSGFNSSDIFNSSLEEVKSVPDYFLQTERICNTAIDRNQADQEQANTKNKVETANNCTNNTTMFNSSFVNNSAIDNDINDSYRAIPETQYIPARNLSLPTNDEEDFYIPETQEILPSAGIADYRPLPGIAEQSIPLELDSYIPTPAEANQFLVAGISGQVSDDLDSQIQLGTQDFHQSVGTVDNFMEHSLLLRSPPVIQNDNRANQSDNAALLELDLELAREVFEDDDGDDADLTPDIDPQQAVIFCSPGTQRVQMPETLSDEVKQDEQAALEGARRTDAPQVAALSQPTSARCGGIKSLGEIDIFPSQILMNSDSNEHLDQLIPSAQPDSQQHVLNADVAGSEVGAFASSSAAASNSYHSHSDDIPSLSSLAKLAITNNAECKVSADSHQQAPMLLPPLDLIVHDDSTSDNKVVSQNSMNCSSTPLRPQNTNTLRNYFEECNNNKKSQVGPMLGTPNEVSGAIPKTCKKHTKVKIEDTTNDTQHTTLNKTELEPYGGADDGDDLMNNKFGNKISKGKRLDFDILLLEGAKPEYPLLDIDQSFSHVRNYILNMKETITETDQGEAYPTNNQYSVTNLEKQYGFTAQPIPEVEPLLCSTTLLQNKETKNLLPDMILDTLLRPDKDVNDFQPPINIDVNDLVAPACTATTEPEATPKATNVNEKAKRVPRQRRVMEKTKKTKDPVDVPAVESVKPEAKEKKSQRGRKRVVSQSDASAPNAPSANSQKSTKRAKNEAVAAPSSLNNFESVQQKKSQRGRKRSVHESEAAPSTETVPPKKTQRGRKPKSDAPQLKTVVIEPPAVSTEEASTVPTSTRRTRSRQHDEPHVLGPYVPGAATTHQRDQPMPDVRIRITRVRK